MNRGRSGSPSSHPYPHNQRREGRRNPQNPTESGVFQEIRSHTSYQISGKSGSLLPADPSCLQQPRCQHSTDGKARYQRNQQDAHRSIGQPKQPPDGTANNPWWRRKVGEQSACCRYGKQNGNHPLYAPTVHRHREKSRSAPTKEAVPSVRSQFEADDSMGAMDIFGNPLWSWYLSEPFGIDFFCNLIIISGGLYHGKRKSSDIWL